MYAPPPSPQIENLAQAQNAILPFVGHARVRAPSPWFGLKLGLGVAALVVVALVLARR